MLSIDILKIFRFFEKYFHFCISLDLFLPQDKKSKENRDTSIASMCPGNEIVFCNSRLKCRLVLCVTLPVGNYSEFPSLSARCYREQSPTALFYPYNKHQ